MDLEREDGWLLFYDAKVLPTRWVLRNKSAGEPARWDDSNPDLAPHEIEAARAWADHVIDDPLRGVVPGAV